MSLADAPAGVRRVLGLLFAAALACGDDGAGQAQGEADAGAMQPPADDEPPADQGGAQARCVPDETRPCGSAGCAGVERCVAGTSGVAAWQPCDVSGAFSDPALLAAVRRQLPGAGQGPLFELSVRQLGELSAPEAGIASLEGMQCMTGLGRAELYSNAIVELAPLAGLTQLSELILQDNAIVDVTPLTGLSGLQSLLLHINQIRDVQPLSGLTGLRQLSLDENQLSDITPLSGLTQLVQLYLGSNQVSDISAIAPLRQLSLLQLTDNAVSDLAPLAELEGLVSLLAEGNQLSDVSPLVELPALQSAALERNPLDCTSESFAALRMRVEFLTSDCP